MDFGRVPPEELDAVNFALPPEPERNAQILQPSRNGRPRVYVACPVWNHPGFVGLIYPENAKPADALRHYARSFPAIELNTTYYGVNQANLRRWREAVTPGFQFAPKLTKEISHERCLVNCEDLTLQFCNAVQELGDHLGPLFLLLGPNFGPDRFRVLAQYLERFPRGMQLSIELRHPGWFQGRGRDVFDLFADHNVIAIITDTAGRRDVAHMRLTAKTAMVRFAGNRLHVTDFTRIDAWVERLASWFDAGLECVYFFLHQPSEDLNIPVAEHMLRGLNDRLGMDLAMPERVAKQQELF